MPEQLDFDDEVIALEYIKRFGKQEGIAITKERSRKKGGLLSSIDLKCDRGGVYRERRTGTAVRQGTGSRLQHVAEMTVGGSNPRNIISALRQADPSTLLTARTIYNERRRIRGIQLNGRTPIRALIDELANTDNYIFDFRVDSEDRVTHLFFAHTTSVALLRRFGSVLLMDCTYKTNKFRMPLLQVVGITSFWTTFFGCFVFLAEEKQDDYDWALRKIKEKVFNGMPQPITIATDREQALMNAISVVFPSTNNVLCMWHIEKNLVANCKSQFSGDEDAWNEFLGCWRSVVRSYEVGDLENGWTDFKTRISIWLFCCCSLHRIDMDATQGALRHTMDKTLSSSGIHNNLESYIRVSTSHLLDVQEKISLAVVNQEKEYKAKMMNDRIRVAHTHRIHLFSRVTGKISAHALTFTLKQVEKSTEANLPPCSNSFTTTMGLPCAHSIAFATLHNPNATLNMDDFHRQWWIDDSADIPENLASEALLEGQQGGMDIQPLMDRFLERYNQSNLHQQLQARQTMERLAFGPSPSLLDPITRRGRGRPSGSTSRHNTSSTQRDPSAFEISERSDRLCGRCRQAGHNVRNCPN